MSYNIDNIETLKSTLRISRANADKANELDLSETNPTNWPGLVFGEDGYANIYAFHWSGEGSGRAWRDTAPAFVKLLEGDADLILTWEGGDSHSGVRIRSGEMRECEVIMTLAPEDP